MEEYHETARVYTRPAPDELEERELDRAAYREHILNAAGGAMKFEAKARRVFRHGPTATMVRQLLFWDGKGHDPDGYIWKTYTEWWEEEGLTRKELDTARHKLGPDNFGVLEEKRKGVPCRLFYRLDLGRLMEVMFPELDGPPAEDPVPEDTDNPTLNHDSRVSDSDSQEYTVGAVKSGGLGPSHIREHAEGSSDISTTTNGKNDFSASSPVGLSADGTEGDDEEVMGWYEDVEDDEAIEDLLHLLPECPDDAGAPDPVDEVVSRFLSADPDGDGPESDALRLARAVAAKKKPATVDHVTSAIKRTGTPDVEGVEGTVAAKLVAALAEGAS